MSVRRDVVKNVEKKITDAINFDYGIEWYDEFSGAWDAIADVLNDREIDIVMSTVLAKLAPKLREALRNGKIDKDEARTVMDWFDGYVFKSTASRKIIDDLYDYINTYDLIAQDSASARSINNLSDVDQAKTSESVTATPTPAKPRRRTTTASTKPAPKKPLPLDELAKALKLAQSNIKAEQRTSAKDRAQYIKMMSMLRKQGNPTIDGKQLNFEVMEEPRKTAITFNKDNTIATIRPTFKAKITI